ncbi:DUF4834 family protein [Flavobacterium silvaticum]|uniref:DUF4834 family protein n=1 Tax=Flavobacterium silvaticum TaxID=1852020 RepID=A0A972FIS4_9FLAO|nr:DUF4834 family protein [Flavobacterium silvaticum]NMH26784.1 DUF4834 family protein [Flavobacterium silvaticum]
MDTASFNGFLRTVIYIVFFYYLFRFVARLLFPVLVKKAVAHAEEKFRSEYGGYTKQDYSRKPDGDISIDTTNAKPTREKKKVGDYVDFEEID